MKRLTLKVSRDNRSRRESVKNKRTWGGGLLGWQWTSKYLPCGCPWRRDMPFSRVWSANHSSSQLLQGRGHPASDLAHIQWLSEEQVSKPGPFSLASWDSQGLVRPAALFSQAVLVAPAPSCRGWPLLNILHPNCFHVGFWRIYVCVTTLWTI